MKILLLLCALIVSVGTAAEVLPDPTRPAIDLNGGSASAADVVPDEAVTRGLQSILISPGYRAAIINGETVGLGEKSGDSTLVEVRENSVVLQNAQGRRVIELFPKVNIKKNGAAQSVSRAQENTSGQIPLPENAVGEIK
jgi:hypothetical protein